MKQDHSGLEPEKDKPGDDDHGHDRTVTIIVNTREKTWAKKKISFAEVIALAFDPPPSGGNWSFTVAYRRGQGNKPEGSLVEGQSVQVKGGMIFNATATDKS
jgi:hypothetical protein